MFELRFLFEDFILKNKIEICILKISEKWNLTDKKTKQNKNDYVREFFLFNKIDQ